MEIKSQININALNILIQLRTCANIAISMNRKLGFNILLCDKLDKSVNRGTMSAGEFEVEFWKVNRKCRLLSCEQLRWSDRVTKQGEQLR